MIRIRVDVARGGAGPTREFDVPEGTLVRSVVRQAGLSPEGCAVFLDGVSVPRDLPLERPAHLTLVPTFSGG